MKIMNKEKFLNDLHECINGYWDSFPPEIQDDFNAVYDKHNEENDAEKEEMIDEIISICNANKNNIYCDSDQLINMIKEIVN